MATRKLTRKQAIAALGDMPERSFARLVSEGLPREGDGQSARFPWPEIHVWLLERERRKAREAAKALAVSPSDMAMAEAERREAAAKAELAELKLAELRRETVTVADARRWFADACGRVRSKLVNGPRQVALRVTGATIPEREREAQGVFDEIMRELAEGADVPEDAEESAA